jgi:hypothetical protein
MKLASAIRQHLDHLSIPALIVPAGICPYQTAGGGVFLGFFSSLFLRCCPFAMIVLLV